MKSITKPRQRRAFARINEIQEAATLLLEKDDYSKINTNSIARRAGVGIATLYRYFADRESIVHSICDKVIDASFSRIERKVSASRPQNLDELIAVTVKELVQIKRDNSRLEYALEFSSGFSSLKMKIMQRYDDRLYRFFIDLLNAYPQIEGDRETKLKTCLHALKGALIFTNYSEPKTLENKDFERILCSMIKAALLTPLS